MGDRVGVGVWAPLSSVDLDEKDQSLSEELDELCKERELSH